MRIHAAARQQSFQGTFVVSTSGVVSSSRIAHSASEAASTSASSRSTARPRQVLRHNDTVYTVWPAKRSVLIEQRDLIATFPAPCCRANTSRIDGSTNCAGGTERMAGRDADLLWLRPRDKLRFGYRLWADKVSGLLLRVEVLGDQGEVLESSAFSEVTIGVKPQPDSVLQAMKRVDGYRIVKPTFAPVRLGDEGWVLRTRVPGFEQVSCVKRSLDGLPGDDREPSTEVLQAIFSDGLTHVSLFIEPYQPARHHRSMLTSIGATHADAPAW